MTAGWPHLTASKLLLNPLFTGPVTALKMAGYPFLTAETSLSIGPRSRTVLGNPVRAFSAINQRVLWVSQQLKTSFHRDYLEAFKFQKFSVWNFISILKA